MATKDSVLVRLRREKIRLWLPPYYSSRDNDNDALTKLAESLRKEIITTAGKANDNRSARGLGAAAATAPTVAEVYDALVDLRSHAVEKWREKKSVRVRVLATERHFAALLRDEGGGGGDVAAAAAAALFSKNPSWGAEITAVGTMVQRENNHSNALLLRVVDPSPTMTVDEFSSDVGRALNAKALRVIWRGTNLRSEKDLLREIVLGGNATDRKKKSELLCLASGFGYAGPAAAASLVADGTQETTERDAAAVMSAVRSDSSSIEAIREAARTVQNSKRGSRFEVTDQNGNLVPMRQSDTVAFLTALGLHRIGRSKLERQDQITGTAVGRDVASALVFLLEADAEWNNSPALGSWKRKVDNYGLLQLDIAWCYLLLESLDGLDDAVRRLDIAERVLRQQVHNNFVTLALAQAEMNNPIPPLCAVFVRLFLLQGVVHTLQGSTATAAERLGWARLLCQRLRSACPAADVETLCHAYVVAPCTAIAALRHSNGDPDAAGNQIAFDRDQERQATRDRRRQQRWGKCANGVDFVQLDLVPTLTAYLGYGDVARDLGSADRGARDEASGEDVSTSALIVVGLLRLSDNRIDRSLELYNSLGHRVLEQIQLLDEASGRRKRRERQISAEHEVQDVDLTILVSMGVEETRGRKALKATGDVDGALLWLSTDDDTNKCAKKSENKDESDGGDDSTSRENKTDDAHELLENELRNALGIDSKQLLEKEWLGVAMQEEWELIQKYTVGK